MSGPRRRQLHGLASRGRRRCGVARTLLATAPEPCNVTKLRMHWQLEGDSPAGEAHFFLYREDDQVHCDHRLYSREELERRVGALLTSSGDIPAYYLDALAAFEDPEAPRAGDVPL
jgi:hypothetical protein